MRGELPTVELRQRGRQHGPLQSHRYLAKLGVQLGVVDGHRSPSCEILSERDIVCGEPAPLFSRYPGDHAEHPVPQLEWDGDGAAQVEPLDEVALRVILDEQVQHLVGDLRRQLALPERKTW